MRNSKWKSRIAPLLLTGAVFSLISCGGISSDTTVPTPSTSPGLLQTAVVLGSSFTDPIGTLNLLSINDPHTTTLNVQTTHSDAVVQSFDNLIYVVNRLGADNIEVVDPAQDFKVIQQFSVGPGTNPQQIIVTSPSKAYVILYQAEDNKSSDLPVDDVVLFNPTSGKILGVIDLTNLTADDGDRHPRPSAMVLVGNRLFIAIQDLPAGFTSPDQPGKIAVIDTTTDSVVTSITLAGRNPAAMNYSPDNGMIYVADADYVNTTSPYGGIEVVDTKRLQTRGIWIDDADLGGAPADIDLNKTRGYTAVSFLDENFNFVTKVVSFDLDPDQKSTLTELYRSKGYIQDIAVDQNGKVLVGDRDPAVNGILFIDPDTKSVIAGPINTGAAPSSITFINR